MINYVAQKIVRALSHEHRMKHDRTAPSNARRTRCDAGKHHLSGCCGSRLTLCLACAAAVIFLDIVIKGSRTVFTSTAPFINIAFLTESPQTLYIFEWRDRKLTLSDREFREWKTTHGEPSGGRVELSPTPPGGIWPCIVGTAMLVIGSMVLALLIGISSAIYLSEYSRNGRLIGWCGSPS